MALTTGFSFDEVRHWPQRVAAVMPAEVQEATRAWLTKERSVTGYLTRVEPITATPSKINVKAQ
jgi:hypothetical protein